MPFILLLVFALVCMQPQWPAAAMGIVAGTAATWVGVLLFVVIAWRLAQVQARRVREQSDNHRALIHRFTKLRRRHFLVLLGFYLVTLYGLGWGWVVKENLAALPGLEIVILLPLLAGLVLTWACFYPADRAAASGDASFPGRLSYVLLQARHNFLLMVPPVILLLAQQSLVAFFPDLQANDYLLPIAGLLLVGVMLVCTPWLLRIILSLKPLPEGPIRTRLMESANRLGFRFTDILLWDTRNTVANAMVTGPLPFLRYVVLSDRLIEELTPDEIEAVFGHEVGHIKHQHILLYFVFFLASTIVIAGMWKGTMGTFQSDAVQAYLEGSVPVLRDWLNSSQLLVAPPIIGLMAVYIFVVFGFLSRRCERQADIYGGRVVSCEALIQALEKVAQLNGMHRKKPGWLSSWQHSTIALRVEFLRRLAADPTLESRFQRHVGLVKWGMAICLAAVLFLLGPKEVWAILKQL